ncbi:MAG TPA: ammonium transporter [Chloroflexota bacterium]|nr:ammonium transporter [Chloroflexota bacterium]
MLREIVKRRALAHLALLFLALPLSVLILVGCGNSMASTAKGDPAGTATGSKGDVVGQVDGAPLWIGKDGKPTNDLSSAAKDKEGNPISEIDQAKDREPLAFALSNMVGQNRVAINIVWTLVTGFLVMFMQAGFALVEAGFTRAKNANHTMMMNFMIYGLGMLGFYICGFAFMFGGLGGIATMGGGSALDSAGEASINLFGKPFGLFGTNGFFLAGGTYDVAVAVMFLFQMVFMDTAATIPTGAMAERWKFSAFCVFGFFCSTLTYPIFGNWAWGGGWLSQLGANFGLGHGYADFAGSGVVHSVGGWMGLAGAMVLGPRIGKFNKDGSPNAIPGHNVVIAALGTFILAFGWFGFNPGSTLAASGSGALRIGLIAVNTMLAGAAASLAAMLYMWITRGKPDAGMMINGILAGLVAITAPSGFVSPVFSVVIGLIAGVLVCWAVWFFDNVAKVDDPVGAISVHGVCGAWGVLSLGLFADGTSNYGGSWNTVPGSVTGLLYGDPGQFVAQVIGVVACFTYVFGLSYAFFKVVDSIIGMRVAPEVELSGLDIPEMGAFAYPQDYPGVGSVYPVPSNGATAGAPAAVPVGG